MTQADVTDTSPPPAAPVPDPGQPQKDAQTGHLNMRGAIVDGLEHTYGPWLVVIAVFVFFRLDPSTEVLVGFLADWQGSASASASKQMSNFGAWLALSALPIAAHAAAHVTLRYCHRGQTGRAREEEVERWLVAALPVLCIAGYLLGFVKAKGTVEADQLKLTWETVWTLWSSVAAVVVAYLILFMRFDVLIRMKNLLVDDTENTLNIVQERYPWVAWLYRLVFRVKAPTSFQSDIVAGFWAIVVLVVGLLVLAAVVGFWKPAWARIVGPVGIVTSFGITACIVFSAMTALSSRMPGNAPLILLAVALSFAVSAMTNALIVTGVLAVAVVASLVFGGVRRIRGAVIYGGAALLTLGYAVSFSQVKDCKTLAGCNLMEGVTATQSAYPDIATAVAALPPSQRALPVRIAAAQGGGLYAAYHTAYYLAARADRQPGFAESLFAISGVSGGSVGAGVYWAVRVSGLCPLPTTVDGPELTCHRDAVDAILRRDFLSPSVATFLFRDLFDTFIPVSAIWQKAGYGPIDRGHVLEDEIASAIAAWQASHGLDPDVSVHDAISDSIVTSAPPEPSPDGAPAVPSGAPLHPLLFLNGTRVDNGTKAVVSPVDKVQGAPSNLTTAAGNDMSVLNGMVISARFPLVTPPGRVVIPVPAGANTATQTVQLVDGGYFDNSGIETALDIILDMQTQTTRRIELIVFSSSEPTDAVEMKGTLGAPLAAFTGAWRARRDQSEARVDDLDAALAEKINLDTCHAVADAQEINYTVSWYLSAATFDNIKEQINATVKPTECEPAVTTPLATSAPQSAPEK